MSIKGRREFLTQMAAFNGGLLTLSPAVETGSPIAFPLDLEQLTSAGANPQHLDDNLIESLHSMTRILAGQRHTLPLNTLLGPMLAHKEHVASFFKSANSEPIQRSLGLAL
ncbi:MAG: hypothetical protein ACREN8_12130, partial [Candidatus Dormibacteraceae bacterium]